MSARSSPAPSSRHMVMVHRVLREEEEEEQDEAEHRLAAAAASTATNSPATPSPRIRLKGVADDAAAHSDGGMGSMRSARRKAGLGLGGTGTGTAAPGAATAGAADEGLGSLISSRRRKVRVNKLAPGAAGPVLTPDRSPRFLSPHSIAGVTASPVSRASTHSAPPHMSEFSLDASPDSPVRSIRGPSATPRSGRVGDLPDGSAASTNVTPRLRVRGLDEGLLGSEMDEEDELRSRMGVRSVLVASLRAQRGGAGVAAGGAEEGGMALDANWTEQLRSNPLCWVDPVFAAHATNEVFNHYTTHQRPSGREGAKYMDFSGLNRLATDVVDRFVQVYEVEMARTNPKFTPEQVRAAVLADLPHTAIGGGLSELGDIKTRVFNLLKRELDRDHDSRVSRQDFIFTWKNAVTRLMQLPKVDTKQLCVIL